MIVRFKNYLHDDEFYEDDLRWALTAANVTENIPDDIITKAIKDRPFYEVALECELHTETGKIEIIGLARDH